MIDLPDAVRGHLEGPGLAHLVTWPLNEPQGRGARPLGFRMASGATRRATLTRENPRHM